MWPEIIVGLGVAWMTGNAWGLALAGLLPPDNADLAQAAGIVGYVIVAWSARKSLQRGFRGASAGFWTSILGRFLIGRIAGTAVLLALLKLSLVATQLYLAPVGGFLLTHGVLPFSRATAIGVLLWTYGSSLASAWALRTPAKVLIGKSTRRLRRLYRTLPMGRGGSAAFAGLLEEWANPWRPGKLLLGASMYDRKWLVGVKDDRHKLTISSTGGGKGRCAIIPNLLTWLGSILCIDVKDGQNAAVTARRRQAMGQKVYVFAPLGAPAGLEDMLARFNALADLDPDAGDYVEQIALIADALVIPGGDKSLFWDQSARTVIAGIVDYLVRAQTPLIAQQRTRLLEDHSQKGMA